MKEEGDGVARGTRRAEKGPEPVLEPENDNARVPDPFEIRAEERHREILRLAARDVVFIELHWKFLPPEHEVDPIVIR